MLDCWARANDDVYNIYMLFKCLSCLEARKEIDPCSYSIVSTDFVMCVVFVFIYSPTCTYFKDRELGGMN